MPDTVLDNSHAEGQSLGLGDNRIEKRDASVEVVATVTGVVDRSRLATLTLVVSGTKIVAEPDMLQSLVEPHWIHITRLGDRVYVALDGRDASESYTAIFTIANGRITERLLAMGEFRHQIWERTIYHNDFIEHPERYKNM